MGESQGMEDLVGHCAFIHAARVQIDHLQVYNIIKIFQILKYNHLFPALFPHVGPTSIPSMVLVAIIGELDVAAGAGGVGDLLELEAAGSLHQISGHFPYQFPVSFSGNRAVEHIGNFAVVPGPGNIGISFEIFLN